MFIIYSGFSQFTGFGWKPLGVVGTSGDIGRWQLVIALLILVASTFFTIVVSTFFDSCGLCSPVDDDAS